MTYHETGLKDVFEVHLEPRPDPRGFFARTWCREEFASRGLNPRLEQSSVSINTRKGTLRGMHYQAAPYAEAKLVRCTQGAIHDVVVDLRPDSPTFKKWIAATLTAQNRRALYIPEGCGHGFLTLADETEVLYHISEAHNAASARGVRWDDPAFGIAWPEPVTLISERDRTYPDFESQP